MCCFALFVCLTLLASFFLPSHLSFKNMYNGMYNIMYTCSTTQWLETALHCASDKGHHETVQLLLEKGADPNVQDEVSVLLKSSPVPVMIYILYFYLISTTFHGILCTFIRLCMYMYNGMYTCSTTQDQRTALHHASRRGDRETVQLLLEKGADPNVQNKVSVLLKSSLYLYIQYACVCTQ